MKKELTNDIAYAAMILTGAAMGYCSTMTLTAHKMLFDGYKIPSYSIGKLNAGAIAAHNAIARDNRTEEANRIADNILTEAGY